MSDAPAQVCHVMYLSEKPGQNPFSGAENHIMALCAGLAGQGMSVELVILLWNDGPKIRERLEEARRAGVSVHLIERPPRSLLGRVGRAIHVWGELTRHLRSRREHIVHLHLDLVMCPIAAWRAGCRRVVISIHNDERYYATWRWRTWLRFVARRTHHFIGITGHVRQYFMRQAGLSASQMTVVYYGVEMPRTQSDPRAKLGLAPGFTIGFVGRLTAQKDVGTLLRALASFPDVNCALVGDGEERPALEALARELGVAGRVRFFGAIPDASGYMQAFDLLCLPSRWEGLGLVLVEAMLLEVPIVGSRAGAIPEVLDQGRCGWLCDPGDVPQFVAAIDNVRRDPAARAQRTAAALQRAVDTFVTANMLRRTREIYASCQGAA
jgi:glycosyltransferase involved in cell wall biosynthesis